MHDPIVPPAAPAPVEPAGGEDGAARLGPVGGAALFLVVVPACLLAWARLLEAEVVRHGARDEALAIGVGALAVLALVRVRAGRLTAHVVLLGLLAAAAVALGRVDLPAWPSAESFGRSPWFVALIGAVAALSVVAASRRGRADGALVVWLALATAGGALFTRRADPFLPLLGCVAAVGLWPGRGSGIEWRRAPFLAAYAALLLWALVPTLAAGDVERHLTGWSRIAIAAFPLLVLGGGAPRVARAWGTVGVVLATVGACAVAAAITIGEAAAAFDLRHAFAARLSLFGVHPNLVAPFFALALPLAGAFVVAPGRGRRGLGLAAFAAAGALLLLTRSRAAILAGGLGTAAFVTLLVGFRIFRARPRRSTVAGLLGLGLAAAAGLLAVGHERVEAKLSDSSMRFRLYVWGVAGDAIAERPVRGHGLLSGEPLAVHATPSDLDGTSKNVHAHDVLLALALGAGGPAAALYLLLLTLLVVRLVRALPRLDAGGRALAAGVVASALALFGANLLDLGLSNHAPIAFHLGWLLGVAGLLVRVARGADERAPSPLAVVAARGASVLLVLALAWNTVALAGEAGSAWTRRLLARGELAAADRWSAALRRLNPHDLSIGMLRVRVLRRAARTAAERETLRELAARHPNSPIPLEALSALELARGRLEPALEALSAARALDPTGPLASEWSLRAARIELRRGRRKAALEGFAEALRYDTQAARRVDWRRDEDGRWVTGDDGATVALDAVLERNRALLEGLVRDDPVRARRAAAALAFTYRQFGRDEEAVAVVDAYEAYGGAPFVPLLMLRTEIRGEREDDVATNERSAPESERFHAPGDTAALRLAEGRRLSALGRPKEARASLRDGIAAILDFASESENLGRLSEEVVGTFLAEGDVEGAAAALALVLYANEGAARRVPWIVEVASAAAEAGRPDVAARVADAAVGVVPHLVPGRDSDALDGLAALLARLDREAADRFLERVGTSGAGLSLAGRVHAARGDHAARRSLLERLREEFPAWAE